MASSWPSLDVCDFLQERVEELSFVDDAQKLKGYRCCACANVAISHCIANCGHVFCSKCCLNYFRKPCPNCQAKLTSINEDDEFESAVLELKVKCKFTKNGCEEVISVIDFLKHTKLCKFASDKHLSKSCRENPVPESRQQINDDFDQIKEVMDRMQTEFTNLKCKVQDIERSAKTLQDQHKEELEKLETRHKKRFDELESKLMSTSGSDIQESDQRLHPDNDEDEFKGIFMWKISGFKEKWQRLTGRRNVIEPIIREESFNTEHGFRFKPYLTRPRNRHSSCYICIELDFCQDRIPSSLFLHSRKFVLLDQGSANEKQNVELIERPEFKKNSAEDTMEPSFYSSLFFPIHILEGENNYVKNDQILIQIMFEPISIMWKQIESRDGVFLWRIEDYSRKKKDAILGLQECLTSKLFQTSHVMGYTAYLESYLNGYEEEVGKYIRICLCIALGEHDSSLLLPFKCNYQLSLMDQSDSPTKLNISQELDHEFHEGELSWWSVAFVPQSTVESSKYLKNDSILIRATLNIL